MTNKSRICKEITIKDTQKIVQDIFGWNTEIKTFKILSGGMFNTTYFIETVNPSEKLVLRVAPIRQELLFDFEKNMMSAEPGIYELLRANNIPVPKVIKYDDSCKIIPRHYIVIEYVEGIPLNAPSVPKENKDNIQVELGGYAAKIHNIKSKIFGRPNHDSTVKGHEKWSEVISEFTEEIADKVSEYKVFSEEQIRDFQDFFHKNINLFDINIEPCLVHGDLWEPNVIVKKDGESFRIAAIIDADRAIYADPEFEYVLWFGETNFMKGYGKQLDMSKEGVLRRKAYMLIFSFMNAYSDKVQFDNEADFANSKKWALESLEQVKFLE